ncbi:hypothetical protein PN4B1_22880 [Paenibacillus naphthalenovorans]|uniref:hypothetical protein n=1 Tax=Paenibacillus naphthalenovorans TaxID=162209 RepID=UPI0010B13747|nr:hypothetical protein [Paenibacillus naphthalenovorans]GCL72378.1 hypothetical protein PN4B1_22880 [Paenibacillus naphthalenovorans]
MSDRLIRLRKTAIIYVLLLISVLLLSSKAFAGTNQVISGIVMDSQSTNFSSNTHVTFKLKDNIDVSQLEFQLWEKYDNEDWEISIPYQDWPLSTYKFSKTGSYALQVDVRQKSDHTKIQQFWLGQFISLPEREFKYIENFTWTPSLNNININTPITFTPKLNNSASLDSLEFQLWEKYENEDWVIKSPYQSWPLPNYQFKKSGNYAIQIDVRDKRGTGNTQKIWLGQFYANDKQPDKLVQKIDWDFPGTTIPINTPFNFQVNTGESNLDDLEFQLYEKFENEPWQVVYGFQKWPLGEYKLRKAGNYAIQIDVRNTRFPERVEHIWLGEINAVPDKETKLVDGISWRPFFISMNVDTPVNFVLDLGNEDFFNLEFQLWSKYNDEDWVIVNNYQQWPLPSYQFTKPGIYSLQINVRNRTDQNQIQKIWLGQFYPHNKNREENSDYLIRRLLANYPSPIVNEKDYLNQMIYDINLSVHMIYWDYKAVSISEQEQLLKGLSGLESLVKLEEGKYKIKFVDSQEKIVNLNDNSLDSGEIRIRMKNDNYPNIVKVFQETDHLPKDVQIASAITYALYVNYMYSQVPYEIERPRVMFYSTIAQCQNFSLELAKILGTLGYNVRSLNLAYNGSAAHALNEMYYQGKKYVLDSTSGVVYDGAIDDIVKNNLTPIVLPQVRDLNLIWSPETWHKLQQVSIAKEYGSW